MKGGSPRRVSGSFFVIALSLVPFVLGADQVPVRHTEGRIHGFLVLRDQEDNILASGGLTQLANGNRVTSELTFHFKDGSLQQETTVFSQARVFRLLNYHLIQKGPAFKRPTDMTVNTSSGQVTIRYTDDDGKVKATSEQMKLPPDLANGMVTTLLGDIDPTAVKTTVSMLVSTPKPRVVKLEISPLGDAPFTVAGSTAKALRFRVKVEIGGISGVVAPIIGKQPPDTHVWMIEGKAPGFLKSEGPMFEGGPIWRIELASPVWPKSESTEKR
jgi:hypothetical protein